MLLKARIMHVLQSEKSGIWIVNAHKLTGRRYSIFPPGNRHLFKCLGNLTITGFLYDTYLCLHPKFHDEWHGCDLIIEINPNSSMTAIYTNILSATKIQILRADI